MPPDMNLHRTGSMYPSNLKDNAGTIRVPLGARIRANEHK